MMRRIAVVGDQIGPGGGEITSSPGLPATFHGHQVALIGGHAYCKACKSVGVIAQSGGANRMSFMGEIALDGDFVFCGCSSPRRIIASLAGDSWHDDMEESGSAVASSLAGTGGVAPVAKDTFDEQVRAVGKGATDGYAYYIETADGRVYSGRLVDGGRLPRIETGANADEYSVYWGDEALARQNGA